MKISLGLIAAMTVSAAAYGDLVPPHFNSETIDGSYIVVMHANTTEAMLTKHVSAVQGLKHTYVHSMKGFSAKMTDDEVQAHLNSPLVDYIEHDQVMKAIQTSCHKQATTLWGLKRLSVVEPDLSGDYHYGYTGQGVSMFIVDTGIRTTHKDFGGRATFGFKAESSWSSTDMNGHGTHVASTTGGTSYGVAKDVNLVAVKVLGDNGSGTNSGVIAGVDYVAGRAKTETAVGNMSLGGGFSSALNSAVNGAISAGVKAFAVAAGNDSKDAKNYSPASAASAITVGSSDIDNKAGKEGDIRSYFSNFGKDVDVFAPGSSITGAWYTSDTATNTISGTSMASPHVAGVAALVASGDSTLTPTQVKARVVQDASANMVDMNCNGATGCSGTTEALLFSSCS